MLLLLSCLLPADFSFAWSLFTRMWVVPLACPVCCLLTSLSLCFCSLECECWPLLVLFAANLSFALFSAHQPLNVSVAFFSPVLCLLASYLLCLCSSVCECGLCFSCSLSADLSFALHLLTRLWVMPLACPVCCLRLLTPLFLYLCSPLAVCECCLLLVLFAVCYLLTSISAHQDVSAASCLYC